MNKVLQAIIFGFVFGFLLQKGGVTKYHLLEGQLLLVDFTVMKVMLSAILVGMIGFTFLERKGKAKLQIKPAKLGANVIGGLIFGTGFALAGYCPGTGAAALGQGSLSAFFYMGGMLVGSYLFAELSKTLSQTVEKWKDLGKITLPEILSIPKDSFLIFFSIFLLLILLALSQR